MCTVYIIIQCDRDLANLWSILYFVLSHYIHYVICFICYGNILLPKFLFWRNMASSKWSLQIWDRPTKSWTWHELTCYGGLCHWLFQETDCTRCQSSDCLGYLVAVAKVCFVMQEKQKLTVFGYVICYQPMRYPKCLTLMQ